MVLGKSWLFSIGNGAEIRPLEKGRNSLCIQCEKLRTVLLSAACNSF